MIFLVTTNLITLFIALFFIRKYMGSTREKKAFQKLMNNVNIGYYRYRYRDGVIVEANSGFTQILELGEDPHEVKGRSLSELLVYIDSEGSIRERVKAQKQLKNLEYHFRTLKGKDKWVLHNSRIFTDPVTGENMIEVLIEDITEERISYEKMKESQERYEKLFKNSGDMVLVYDPETLIIEEVNPITEVITGYSIHELVGSNIEKLFHPSHRKKLEEVKKDLLFSGAASLESVIVCHNGTYREVILTISVVDLDGKRIAITVIKDVSELVKEREEQERRKKELEEFWKASVKREERIKDLRTELGVTKQQLKMLQNKK